METNTVGKEEGTDRAFRDAMVDKLRDWGSARTGPVEAAMRAVPRHAFVPSATLEQAYGPGSVVTHRDENKERLALHPPLGWSRRCWSNWMSSLAFGCWK
ncbi:hypothetical protein ACFQX6_66705 [Streptosporangium lutulentum]